MSMVYMGSRLKPRTRTGLIGDLVIERLHRIFAIIILLQLVQCFTDFWWEETFAVVYGVLAVTAVCELAFTRWYGVRLTLEILASVVFSIYHSPLFQWIGWPDNWKSKAHWELFYEYHVSSLHPFVALGVGAVLTVHALSWLGRSRRAMISILITSIGILATFDSFFPFELWHNIAWVVAAGLGWLVILHLRQLRARHPESWEALSERPVELALPAIIVIAFLLLSGLFVPRAPALLEDPYTIWAESQGREVPSVGGEGGLLSGGGLTGDLGGGSAVSGYGRDDRTIGGGFSYDYSPVMTVTASRRSYWRGETKAVYSGTGWSDRRTPLTAINTGDATNFNPGVKAEGAETEQITQSVTFLRKDRIPVLFGAGPIAAVTELESDNNGGLQANAEEGELLWRRPARVESYSLVSEVVKLDREALRLLPALTAETSIEMAPYLQLPDTLPQRVRDLAVQITADGANQFDKAALLEKYLKENFPYNNKPDVSKQVSEDVVEAFLFEIKEGYCDYYSTAFVVMARSVGIPARWVKGYASGVDPSKSEMIRQMGELEDPDGPGTYTVRNADAHSWAEVYFEGYGWIPFEPTAGFSVPIPVPTGALPEPSEAPAAEETTAPAAAESAGFNWWLAAGGALLLLAAAWVVLFRKRRGLVLWNRIRYAGSTPNQRIVREMEGLLNFMSRRGMKRESHETIRETIRKWGNKFSSLRPDFENILTRFELARYGHDSGAESDVRDFQAAVSRLRKAL